MLNFQPRLKKKHKTQSFFQLEVEKKHTFVELVTNKDLLNDLGFTNGCCDWTYSHERVYYFYKFKKRKNKLHLVLKFRFSNVQRMVSWACVVVMVLGLIKNRSKHETMRRGKKV